MKPVLYSPDETNFATNGLGVLTDTISCTVTEERNSVYELEMTYPVTGRHYSDIHRQSIIKVKVRTSEGYPLQLFRIYKISRPLGGIVEISAEHISYQLSYITVRPYKAAGVVAAMRALPSNCVEKCPFIFTTDIEAESVFQQVLPLTARSILGGVEGSFLDLYKGEYEWDNYTVRLWKSRGSDKGITLRYGKNIVDIRQEESLEEVVTSICPYWEDGEGDVVTLPEYSVKSEYVNSYPFERTAIIDFSSDYENKPTEAQLRSRAKRYIKDNDVGLPKINIEVSFAALWQTEEYKHIAPLEEVNLCDTVHVIFEPLGIKAKGKILKTTYNVLLERYDSLEIGNAKPELETTLKKIVLGNKDLVENVTNNYYSSTGDDATEPLSNFDIESLFN